MSISDQFEDHIHDLLFDIGGIYASQTLIGLSMHSENLFTLVHAARDAISMENKPDFERISWGIFLLIFRLFGLKTVLFELLHLKPCRII